jgi:hypothetical protein
VPARRAASWECATGRRFAAHWLCRQLTQRDATPLSRLRRAARRAHRASPALSVQHPVLSDNREALVHLDLQTDAAACRERVERAARRTPGVTPQDCDASSRTKASPNRGRTCSTLASTVDVTCRAGCTASLRGAKRRLDETVSATTSVTRKPGRGVGIEDGAPLQPARYGLGSLQPARRVVHRRAPRAD